MLEFDFNNMKKPRILLSGNRKLPNYVDAVVGSGGIADAKYLPEIDTDYDGLILCGGNDTDPAYYGEQIDGAVNIDYERDKCEFALLKAFVDAGKPVFGICRGFQFINIFFGGTLHQHAETANKHSSFESYDLIHPVHALVGSVAEKLYGTDFTVNSAHHQSIKKLGDGLKITMTSPEDAVVEGIEHTSLPIIGVQWHPERMCFLNRRDDTVDGAAIFKYFINMCK